PLRVAGSVPVRPGEDLKTEDVDPVAFGDTDDRALAVGSLAVTETGPLALALPVDRVHAGDLHFEDLLYRDLDLGFVGLRADDERVLVLVYEPVALLGHHRLDDDVPVVGDPHLASSSDSAACEAPFTRVRNSV